MLRWLGAGACGWLGGGLAKAAELPLNNTGLEHYGLTVPDSRAAAEFYGRIFDPQLFQERDPPPRYYVKVGISYLAFGQNKEVAPYIDHFCALVQGYGPGELRKLLDAAGVRAGSGPGGMAEDPDGLRLQTLGVPGGLARTIIPATRISQDEALFQAIGTDHVVLRVSDLEKSAEHYRKLFGPELPRTKKPDRVWFAAARTRLALERAGPGEKASIHHVTFRVAGFDPRRGAEKLKRAGIEVVPADDKNAVRFRDPNGLVMELL
jgi:catechol 2,3-dioxygenase-like lactoylglutathione lyase family enzyme